MTGEYSFSDTVKAHIYDGLEIIAILDEELSVFTNVHPVRNWTKGKHLISTNCSAAKQLPQFSSYLNIKYLSNVSIKQIFVRPICHKYQNIRICEGNLQQILAYTFRFFLSIIIPKKVTVHSVPSNTLRDAGNMNLLVQCPRSIVCFANLIYANRINSRGMSRVFCCQASVRSCQWQVLQVTFAHKKHLAGFYQ